MEWFILFITSWILFLFFIDWKKISTNIWCGVIAVLLQIAVDTNALSHNFYEVNRPGIEVLGSSLFFVLGPVLVIGTLIGQFHPFKRSLRVINVIVLAALYSLQELILLRTGALEYHEWHYIDSVVVNICAMIIISWFATVVLEEKGTKWK